LISKINIIRFFRKYYESRKPKAFYPGSPEWITGGSFGIEMSVIATALSLIVGLIIVKKAVKNKQIVSPVWKRTTRS